MADYCWNSVHNPTFTGELQISVVSSYGGIRLWRIAPYVYCPVDATLGQNLCNDDQSAGSVQLQALNFSSFDTGLCTQEFSVFAVSIEYINQWNLAVTVLRTTLGNVDTLTLMPKDRSLSSYAVIWVQPDTLEFQEGQMWQPESPSPALVAGTLCPSEQSMPNVGSMVTEAFVSMVLFVELPLNVVLGLPVLMPLLSNECPKMNRGHTLLKTCGADLLSLDDFFDSVYRYC